MIAGRTWATAVTGLLLAALPLHGPVPADASTRTDCPDPIPVYREGLRQGAVCAGSVDGGGLTVLDLSDGWVPRALRGTAEHPMAFRRHYRALANGERPELDHLEGTGHLASLGVFPSLSLIRLRLEDDRRRRCHERVDGAPLRALAAAPEPTAPSPEAIRAAERHLACDGLLASPDGAFDRATAGALRAFQMRHMLPPTAELDGPTAERMTTPFSELVFREALRTLRERVVDATGLIADGSARNELHMVLGRSLDGAALRPVARARPLADGEPDRIGRATEAAARALGWTHPEGLRGWLQGVGEPPEQVAVRLPEPPPYLRRGMGLSVDIDRGDVWYEFPWTPSGEPRDHPVQRRPALVLYAHDGPRKVPLVRWVTTIGGWRREQAGRRVRMRYHPSPAGSFLWRDLVAAPRWLPPRGIPDDQLVHRHPKRGWTLEEATVGPGPRAAFGLLMVVHHRDPGRPGGRLVDEGFRTHGSGNIESIVDGTLYSHGCHRILPHLALRLGGFVLAHRTHRIHGYEPVRYGRNVQAHGQQWELSFEERGYRYELQEPIPVRVRPGRIRGPIRREPGGLRDAPPGVDPGR